MVGFLLLWPWSGSRGFIQEGTWVEAGHSFATSLKECAPVVLPRCSGQTEEAGGQLYGIRLVVVAGSNQFMPRDAKRGGTGKAQKEAPASWACIVVGKSLTLQV